MISHLPRLLTAAALLGIMLALGTAESAVIIFKDGFAITGIETLEMATALQSRGASGITTIAMSGRYWVARLCAALLLVLTFAASSLAGTITLAWEPSTSPDVIGYEATIEDPKVFTRAWKMSMPLYRRQEKNAQIMDFKCVEFVEELLYGEWRKKPLTR